MPGGIPYLFIKIALEDVGPVTIAAARVLSGGLALLPYMMRPIHLSLFTERLIAELRAELRLPVYDLDAEGDDQ